MARTKNQHFVPRSYLKRFSPDGRTIYVLDKTTGKRFRSNTSNVAAENFFYELPPGKTWDPQGAEKALACLESKFDWAIGDLLREAEESKRFIWGVTERNQYLALFILLQYVRTPTYRETMESAASEFLAFASEIETNRNRTIDGEVAEAVKPPPYVFEPLDHVRHMFGKLVPFGMDILFHHIWFMFHNVSPAKNQTSDEPVVLHARPGQSMHEGVGLGSPGVAIHVPLSPEYTLVLLEPSYWRSRVIRESGDVVRIDEADQVLAANAYRLGCCRRQLFSVDGDFDSTLSYLDTPLTGSKGSERFIKPF